MNYFVDCKTQEEAKKLYKKLVKKHHPDKGGDEKVFLEVKKQFEEFISNDSEKYRRYYEGFGYRGNSFEEAANFFRGFTSYREYQSRAGGCAECGNRIKRLLDLESDNRLLSTKLYAALAAVEYLTQRLRAYEPKTNE